MARNVILTAAMFTALAATDFAAQAKDVLSAAEIHSQVIGIKFKASYREWSWEPKDQSHYGLAEGAAAGILTSIFGGDDLRRVKQTGTAYFNRNGSATAEFPEETFAGRWRLSENQLCPKWVGKDEKCFQVFRVGPNQYQTSHGWKIWK